MVLRKARRIIIKNLSNISGWRTAKRVIVFESDDWGSMRMPSPGSFERLEKAGLDLRSADAERYNMYDTLATSGDLEKLFGILSSVKDSNGNNAIFTPVCVMANPDFRKIEESGFRRYFYEPFTETLNRIPGCENSFSLWKEGIRKKIFVPQLHGREHLNVTAWMKALQSGEEQTMAAFYERMWGFVPAGYPEVDYQAAFLLNSRTELEYHQQVIREAVMLFESLMNYKAEYFVPPNGVFNNSLNKILSENGIRFRYAPKVQHESLGSGRIRKVIHSHGHKDSWGITHIIRNCFFEPSQPGKDWVDNCLNDIKTAFRWNKPAVICTHRVNYTGALNRENREHGLQQLSALLKAIVRYWPDAEFTTTPRLDEVITKV